MFRQIFPGFLFLMVTTALVLPAGAQDNVIRVIQDDGSEVVIDITAPPPAPEPAPVYTPPQRAAVPPQEPEPPPFARIEKIPDVDSSAVDAMPPMRRPVYREDMAPKQAAVEPRRSEEIVPARKPDIARPVPNDPMAEKLLGNVPPPRLSGPLNAPPGTYKVQPPPPTALSDGSKPAPATENPLPAQGGGGISNDQALQIALEHAPPASSIRVFRNTYQDRPVFFVEFKTDSGPHDVVVDALTGEVLAQ